ncbi:MAG TPA: tyrosine-type recombinase/integrase [Polyangiales bacterium]
MAKRKKHKGVVLLKPEGTHGWRARYVDPDSGKFVKLSVPERDATTLELRADWAHDLSQKLSKRKHELTDGATRKTGAAFPEVVEGYFKAHVKHGRKTLRGYRFVAAKLLAWAAENGVKTADELTRPKLMGFKASLVNECKTVPVEQGKRGEKKRLVEKFRSNVTINNELRAAKTILSYLVKTDSFARLSFDDLHIALEKETVGKKAVKIFRQAELTKLLQDALDHDAATYEMTRLEKEAGKKGKQGQTLKHNPIAPFTAFVLLSGMRFSEAVNLTWEQVHLDLGEIHLADTDTKTHHARTVDLAVSPALGELLTKLKEHNDAGSVFGMTEGEIRAGGKRIADKAYWQTLRATCGTFLTCSPSIFGASSAYRSAFQLGHSVQVAEKHYLGLVKNIPKEATTVEAAMGIEAVLAQILEAIPGPKLRLVAAA